MPEEIIAWPDNYGQPRNRAVTVGTTAVKLLEPNGARRGAYIFNNTGTPDKLYLGGEDVTTANGYLWSTSDNRLVGCRGTVWAVAGAAGQDIRVLEVFDPD
jgi:hypothetical protein